MPVKVWQILIVNFIHLQKMEKLKGPKKVREITNNQTISESITGGF